MHFLPENVEDGRDRPLQYLKKKPLPEIIGVDIEAAYMLVKKKGA